MGLLDSLRRVLRPGSSSAMRDRYDDRAAGTDPKFGSATPSGSLGPSGAALEGSEGEGGAIEPDPPSDS